MKFKKLIKFLVPIISISTLVAGTTLALTSCNSDNKDNGTNVPGEDNEQNQDNQLPPWQPPYPDGSVEDLPTWQPPEEQLPDFGHPDRPGFIIPEESDEEYYFTSDRNALNDVKRRQENGDIATNQSDSKYNGVRMAYKYNYQILDSYDRQKVADSIQTYKTNFSLDPNFPGYPSVYNRWEEYDSDFAKKLGFNSDTRDKLFNARVFWRRELIQNEWIVGDENYPLPLMSMHPIPEMQPSDFDDIKYNVSDDEMSPSAEENAINSVKYLFTNPEFVSNEIQKGRLKKHPAADNMWGPYSVPTTQQAVNKSFSISSEWWGPVSLGLYAPAGEIIEFKISDEVARNLIEEKATISIGREWADTKWNKNWYETNFRMPRIHTEFNIEDLIKNYSERYQDKSGSGYILKVGSVFGGSVTLMLNSGATNNKKADYNFNVNGAVEHLNWINGFTTEKEWNRIANSVNTPMITLVTDHTTIFKPSYHGGEPDTLYHDLAKKHSPKDLMEKYAIAAKMSEFMSFTDVGWRRKNNAIYINDFVPAGLAVNMGADHIFAPIYWLDNFLNDNSMNFSAHESWGMLHELNHSFEWKQFGNTETQNPDEVVNNIDTLVELMVLDASAVQRNENKIYAFDSINGDDSGWQGEAMAYGSFRPHYEESNGNRTWKTTTSPTNAWAQWMKIVGIEASMGMIRALGRGLENRHELLNWANNYDIREIKENPAMVTAYLLCAFQQIDITDWIEQSHFYNLITDNGKDAELWQKMKAFIKSGTPFAEYKPFMTLYSSGNFLPTKNKPDSWRYTGDVTRPYQVSMYEPTTFKFDQFTRFSLENAEVKSVEILNAPKFGTIGYSDDKKQIIYTPKSEVKENYMDELIVEITDNFNNKYRTLIRPLMSPSVLNGELTTFTVKKGEKVEFDDGKQWTFDDGDWAWQNDIRDIDFNYQSNELANPKNEGQKYKIEFFENFDKYISQVEESRTSKTITAGNYSGISLGNIEVDNLKFNRFQTLFKANKTGYYRSNMKTNEGGMYLVSVKKPDEEKATLTAYTNYRGGNNTNTLNEQTQQAIYLEEGQVYEINVYIFRCRGNVDKATLDFNNLRLCYVGEEDNYEGLTIFNTEDTLTKNITTHDFYEKFGDSIFNVIKNYEPKFYSWALENVQFFNTHMLTNRFDRAQKVSYDGAGIFDSNNYNTNLQYEVGNKWYGFEVFLTMPDNYNNQHYQNVDESKTSNTATIQLLKEFTTNGFKMNIPNGDMKKRAKYVKVFVDGTQLINETTDQLGRFRINNWWEGSAKSFVDFGQTVTFKKEIKLEFINDIDNSDDIPEHIKNQINGQQPTGLVFGNIRFNDFKDTQNTIFINNTYLLPTSENVTISKEWQQSHLNAKFNDAKLVTNKANSYIEFNIKNAYQFTLYMDIGPAYGTFDLYIDDQKVGSFDAYSPVKKYGIAWLNYTFKKPADHKIKIVSTSNKWLSIQSVGYWEWYKIPWWGGNAFQKQKNVTSDGTPNREGY